MATVQSTESDSVETSGSVFVGDRVVTSFPRHDIVKLDEGSFILWQQQVHFILRGYGLLGFIDGTLTPPTRFVQASDGSLALNLSASIFEQQDNLLTSWLLSTISASFLSSFTDVQTASDVWLMANRLFATATDVKQSQLRHELHLLSKGNLSIWSYVDKIKSLCALLAASGVQILEAERMAVLLVGLSPDFEAVVSYASLSSVLYDHLAHRYYYQYHRDDRDEQLPLDAVQQRRPPVGVFGSTWENMNLPNACGQNFGVHGQNWSHYYR
ncbi:hypothetical protein J1N35_028592 [Gossypium stocksii]|uniref:Retrotransposon Copia-like N-terminal domain-containing protein n=1 Tax=Gossypium stocksii TaxID=47602 RepID=A0A9D3UWN3_9ROSI|nr:hypothetical protein J1N35_028592 [Gossypium stocksii]